uniref:Uncharacterized protein n=1 Tax=Ditylenchus dipsaci TaxID=166011 RepID=A0A915CXW6_9BILA
MPTNIHNLPNNNNFNQNLINNHNNFNNNNGMDLLDCGGCGGSNCPGCGLNGNSPNGCGGGPANGGNGCGGAQMNGNGGGCHPADNGCMMFGNCPPCGGGPGRKRRQAVFASGRFLRTPEMRSNETSEGMKKSESTGQKMLVLRNNLELVLRQDKQKQSGSMPSLNFK